MTEYKTLASKLLHYRPSEAFFAVDSGLTKPSVKANELLRNSTEFKHTHTHTYEMQS